MKILLIGFIAFVSWSVLSTHIYVCRIQGLCSEPTRITQINTAIYNDSTTADTLIILVAENIAVIPDNLIIYFDFDKSEFNADAETDRFIDETNVYLDQNSQAMLVVTGHTDSTGSFEYNQALGYRRAQSVQHYVESKGMSANKIITDSKGENEPSGDNNTRSGRAKNRRSVLTINK
jgi:outer membrane protein OmpA-like peptidoglycan-associated protein